MEKRGRPKKPQSQSQSIQIDFHQISKLKDLVVDQKMLKMMKSETSMDLFISHEGGIPSASNIMCTGDPGVGKTTILLDLLSTIQILNPKLNCLFISGEMGKKQMFKYTLRYPQFGQIDTIFTSDYVDYNTKDTIEQVLNIGWDLVLVDSIAEVLDGVRTDNGWDRKKAESWLVETCMKNNNGGNLNNRFTSFLLIQQVTKNGIFVGSNKMKHMVDSMMEIRKESKKEGEGTYMEFTKNREGKINEKKYFQLSNNQIIYSQEVEEEC